MRIEVPKQTTISFENDYDDCSILNIPVNVARLIYNEMDKIYFRNDFKDFLDWRHEDFEICDTDSEATWSYLWATYQEHQDMNVAEWDTFEDVLQEVYEMCGNFVCHLCGKKLLSEFPPVDCNGNRYCDECGERHLKSDLTYDKDNVGYCEHCKHADE